MAGTKIEVIGATVQVIRRQEGITIDVKAELPASFEIWLVSDG
ncbi:MAG: hypothetical protein ABJP93_01245 [Marinobacter sp.]